MQPPSASLQIAFTNVPDTYTGMSIAIDEISTSFTAMRMPTSCPATPAPLSVVADSYADPTQQTAKAPLTVTDCSALPYAPTLAVTATKDSTDSGVAVQSDVKQAVGEATSSSVQLTLPTGVLAPNPAALGEICTDPSFTGCTPVGSSTATSPLYPTPLTGKAYLTGSLSDLALEIVFPPPFGLTLSGAVNIGTNSTTFSGVPDIPLTDLGVTLSGGSGSLFTSDCTTPSGTASAVLTSQNGDKHASPTSPFTISGCTTGGGGGGGGGGTGGGGTGGGGTGGGGTGGGGTGGGGTGGGGTGGGGTGGGGSGGGGTGGAHAGKPRLGSASLTGLRTGKPVLKFILSAGHSAPKLSSFTVKLPHGLTFVRRRVHGRLTVTGVSLTGAKAKSIALQHGRLVVRLRRAVASLTVKLRTQALAETSGLRSGVAHGRIKHLKLTVVAQPVTGSVRTLTLTLKAR